MEHLVYESRNNLFVDQGLILKAGDKVLLIAPGNATAPDVDGHMELLKRRFPDVEFTVVAGYTGVQIASTNG